MAINVRKGTAHSLLQTDKTATVTVDPITRAVTPAIAQGQLVYVHTDGSAKLVPKVNNATRASGTNFIGTQVPAAQIGFNLSNTLEGDVAESGKVGIYLLDGGSVIETTYFTGTVTIADIGKPILQDANAGADGNVCVGAITTAERIIGWVYDAPRTIYVGQTPLTFLPIKLNA